MILDENSRKSQLFESLGAFFFEFSQLEYTIRVFLAARLNLTEAQFDIVTSPYDFSTLCRITKEVSIQQFPTKHSTINEIFNKCQKLNENRVRIAHGLWSDDGTAITARHVSRQSLKANYFFENRSNELIILKNEANQLKAKIIKFCLP